MSLPHNSYFVEWKLNETWNQLALLWPCMIDPYLQLW